MSFKNYYQVLGLKDYATAGEIRKAYRNLAFRYHPDHQKGGVAGQDQFLVIKEAYEALRNPSRKKIFDAELRSRSIHAPAYGFYRYVNPMPVPEQPAPAGQRKKSRPWLYAIKPLVLVLITAGLMYMVMHPPLWLRSFWDMLKRK